ncbi:hypothetical protein NONI108955_26560 [Nocardia ninae]
MARTQLRRLNPPSLVDCWILIGDDDAATDLRVHSVREHAR